MTTESRYYGVSTGDGNNGVSHMFPNYIVKTDQPYKLAELAALTILKPECLEWSKENMEICGEAEYTIYAEFRESPNTQEERQELVDKAEKYQQLADDETDLKASARLQELADRFSEEAENYGADYTWLIIEVYPWKDELPDGRRIYESLEECFGEDIKLVA